MQHLDAVIVTALPLERAAVRAHLVDPRPTRVGGLVCDVGEIKGLGSSLTVALIETGPGNVASGLQAAEARRGTAAKHLVMVGVAGGVKDVQVGDVVVSSKVYGVEGGKVDGGFKPRPDFAPVSQALLQVARSVLSQTGWSDRAVSHGAGRRLDGTKARVFIGPIAAGEKVLADRESPRADLLATTYGDTLAIDMEDFGVLHSAGQGDRISGISVRGISDLLAGKSTSDGAGSQELAAANAAAFAIEMLLLDRSLDELHRVSAGRPDLVAGDIRSLAVHLYPTGPAERAVWERAGGDLSRLDLAGDGATQWWRAVREIERGGGGASISAQSLLQTMQADFPNNGDIAPLS